jgi:ppGpp synthetase/RelA/SpoT-type nucleotidyltranferase
MLELKKTGITQEEHRRQIEAYGKEKPSYDTYKEALERVLKAACAVSIPEAFVQARSKTLSSFAEKCARRFDRYKDAVNELTDLCGARVIVQTIEQVKAVRQFIEANFEILEKDDKGLQLSEDKFGYRDMHYIIRLRPDRCQVLGITPDEQKTIGERRAEVQVRTWLQHAWADTLHDRMYKNSLTLSADLRRAGALLAALMEEGDRNFNVMAGELDGMIANYTAFALRNDVEKEIDVQELILKNEPRLENKPILALKLARLWEACGDYGKIVAMLDPHKGVRSGIRCELIQYLGYALCKENRNSTGSIEYQRGKDYLEESILICTTPDRPFVPHLRRQEGLHARALSWIGWVEEQIPGNEHKARECRRRAHEHEPSNPYYLSDMLGFEMKFTYQSDLSAALRTVIREAITTCRNQATAGIELPYAYFTAGRLSFLLDQSLEALGYYARGVKHYLTGEFCFPADVVEEEIAWMNRLHFGKEPPAQCRWVHDLLSLTLRINKMGSVGLNSQKVLILTGGAASINLETLEKIRPLIQTALRAFSGKVICGGTIVGVPGLVGEVSAELAANGEKQFELVGYIPKSLPHDGPKDIRYDRLIVCGDDKFLPEQILCNWIDLIDNAINPKEILLLGFGGGPLSALEYRLALAFGASVAVVDEVGGASKDLVKDILWSGVPNLMPLPFDTMSVQAFVTQPGDTFGDKTLEEMAMAFHANYVSISSGRLPDNMKPWPNLKETFKKANIEQARYAVRILETCGFKVREVPSPSVFQGFSDEEIKRMAEMEHGRWNMERLKNGWRFGTRDDDKKLHNCLVKWKDLPESIKKYDLDAVRSFPSILAKAGLEISRE